MPETFGVIQPVTNQKFVWCVVADELKYETKFIGYDAPHEFLVGYGLDHAESFRHLPYIASLL